jgi:hypothetical protein
MTFFKELGALVLERWKQLNFSLEKFPSLAVAALKEHSPAENVALGDVIADFLLREEQPLQSQSGFGQPELIVYEHPRFYIQLLFWLDGTTDIHQHEFSGAFHVMHGSSIHALYEFENQKPVTPYLRVGDLRMKEIELLEQGRTVAIVSGAGCIHSLFHLDTPSVTVVLRTHNDPGTSPQFNYLPPHLAVDPMHSDTLTLRRRQLLDVLEQTHEEAYTDLVLQMVTDLDFERGFYILQNCMTHLQDLGSWTQVMAAFKKKHGALAKGVAATLEEGMRREMIKGLRSQVVEPEHRFFLALLMNVSDHGHMMRLVQQRFPEQDPVETTMQWAEELAGASDEEASILDAYFPRSQIKAPDAELELLLAALRYELQGRKALPAELELLTAKQLKSLRAAFDKSCLSPLLPALEA